MSDRARIVQARKILNPRGARRDPLTRLRDQLVNSGTEHRGGPEQREMLEAVRDNRLVDYLASQGVGSAYAELGTPSLADKLQEAEFVKAPVNTARRIRATYTALTPQEASNVSVWNAITLHNISVDRMDASYLAASNERESGRARIEKAFGKGTKDARNKAMDACVRTVFRTMGGLMRIRGNVSVISDCTLSRHWWLGHVIESARAELALDETRAWEELNRHWSVISGWAVKRLTLLAVPSVMAGLTAYLAHAPAVTTAGVEDLMKRIGSRFSETSPYAWSADEVRSWLARSAPL